MERRMKLFQYILLYMYTCAYVKNGEWKSVVERIAWNFNSAICFCTSLNRHRRIDEISHSRVFCKFDFRPKRLNILMNVMRVASEWRHHDQQVSALSHLKVVAKQRWTSAHFARGMNKTFNSLATHKTINNATRCIHVPGKQFLQEYHIAW